MLDRVNSRHHSLMIKAVDLHVADLDLIPSVTDIVTGFDQRSCATSDPVSTRMGDRLWTGKPSRYVTSQLG